MAPDLTNPYLKKQLIAYIGNKRSLLPFISQVLDFVESYAEIESFLDPFAGSGSVSRLAKLRGYRVFAADWEPYAFIVNAAHVSIDRSEVPSMFASDGGLEEALRRLNGPVGEYASAGAEGEPEGVMARYYAPGSADSADYKRERMFYTRENALFMDRVRENIEDAYPGWDLSVERLREKYLLLALLVYQAATHANTSGVFKAFHKGFGGFGADALKRILAPMRLDCPVLIDGKHPCRVGCEDAQFYVSGKTVDLCYLDPPYNSHQYGSNYHILNTIVFGDEPPIDDSRTPEGLLVSKAGIRRDWKKTKSPFCYRESAPGALNNLLQRIDARFVLVSYNTEGIIPFDALFEMLSSQGTVQIKTQPYVKYRGGKQSIERMVHNQEILLLLDRARALRSTDPERIRRLRLAKEIEAFAHRRFHPERFAETFDEGSQEHTLVMGLLFDLPLGLTVDDGMLLLTNHRKSGISLNGLSVSELERLRSTLSYTLCRDRLEETLALVELLDTYDFGANDARRHQAVRELVATVKKFAFRKYRDEFEYAVSIVRKRASANPDNFPGVNDSLDHIERIASLRFNG